MQFPRLPLRESIEVSGLISFHYFEYAKGFVFEGEQHDFWEFLYVDKGEVEVRADDRTIELKQGEIVFHRPEEFHSVRVRQHHKPPNLIVIAFECRSSAMAKLEGKAMALGDKERNLLTLLLQEGFHTFHPPFDNPSDHTLSRREEPPFASEQAVKTYLELLLIHLIRGLEQPVRQRETKLSSAQKEKAERSVVRQIEAYMRENLSRPITLDLLCAKFHLGKSRLKQLFQSQLGMGAMEYFKAVKIEQARTLIREEQYNYTEIAGLLGYGTIHHFSRDFKKATGMSPSAYGKSVKARIVDRP